MTDSEEKKVADAGFEKKPTSKRTHKKLKSTGSISIEEEEANLAQISLEQEGLLAEEKQELDTFLETAEELEASQNDQQKLSDSANQEPMRDSSSPNPMSHANLVLEKTEEVEATYITTPVEIPQPLGSTTDDGENS